MISRQTNNFLQYKKVEDDQRDNFNRRSTLTSDDPKKESQLSQADKWLNDAIDPSAGEDEEDREDEEDEEKESEQDG